MTIEEYVQKAISEAKSTSGAVYAILALMEEIANLRISLQADTGKIAEAINNLDLSNGKDWRKK